MTTRVTEGARRERFFSGCHPHFSRLAASPLNARAGVAPLTKSEEKQRLLAVYMLVVTAVKVLRFHYAKRGTGEPDKMVPDL